MGDGILAFRLSFLLANETGAAGEAEPFYCIVFLLMEGKLSMKEWKVCLVSSFRIFDISVVSSYASALNGETLFLLLFPTTMFPSPTPPEANVVFEPTFYIVRPGLRVGIVLTMHR